MLVAARRFKERSVASGQWPVASDQGSKGLVDRCLKQRVDWDVIRWEIKQCSARANGGCPRIDTHSISVTGKREDSTSM